jgi:hypothetical protein
MRSQVDPFELPVRKASKFRDTCIKKAVEIWVFSMFTTTNQFIIDSKVRWKTLTKIHMIVETNATVVKHDNSVAIATGQDEMIAFFAQGVTRWRSNTKRKPSEMLTIND